MPKAICFLPKGDYSHSRIEFLACSHAAVSAVIHIVVGGPCDT